MLTTKAWGGRFGWWIIHQSDRLLAPDHPAANLVRWVLVRPEIRTDNTSTRATDPIGETPDHGYDVIEEPGGGTHR